MKRIVSIAVLLLGLVYVGDYLSLRYRIPGNREPLGTVRIQRYYAVPQKNRKTEFMFDEPETEVCAHSLFPHLGYRPCWYVNRKKLKRIDV